MKKFLIVLSFLLLCPISAWANCSNSGITVVFINGLFGDINSADYDRYTLKDKFKKQYPSANVKFITGFNESHLGGADDLAKGIMQSYGYESLDYDLTTILNQIYDEISTKKILLVGYSQGSFYSNAAYKYLIGHGALPESIGVYNVGTPASYVAGGGKYITSSTDKVINDTVRKLTEKAYARAPLPANVDIKLNNQESSDTNGGHGFSSVYLNYEYERIVSEIYQAINKLNATGSESKECFKKPGESLAYKIKKIAKNFGDGVIDETKNIKPDDFATGGISALSNFIAWISGGNKELDQIPCIYGPTLSDSDSPTGSFFIDTEESSSQIINIVKEVVKEHIPDGSSQTTTFNLQEILDDIAEKIDIIAQQIRDLQPTQEEDNQEKVKEVVKEEDSDESDQDDESDNDTDYYQPGVGGGVAVTYSTILISEIQTAGDTDEKEEFVELYNPTNTDVNLTGWYLQRKTATGQSYSSYASSTLFKDKTIPAKGYFVIARVNYFAMQADIFTSNSISSNNSFVLKNPNGEISDKVGWGEAQDFETAPTINPQNSQTIGRIFLTADDTEKDTQNNFADFEAQAPTPKAQNITIDNSGDDNGDENQLSDALIKINEIQVAGVDDEKQEFVELYNPTDADVDLTGWYLQRKTADGEDYTTYASSTLFNGKTIASESYFVIAREGYFTDTADIFTTNPLTDSNTLVLKRKGGSIADKVGWGEAQDFETQASVAPLAGQTIERKVTGQDTDNNFVDFVVRGEASPGENIFGLSITDTSDYTNNFLPDQSKYALQLSWDSKINDAFYDVQYKFNSFGWQTWLSHTIGETEKFENAFYSIIEDKNTYSFRVKAFDSQGNESGWKYINIDLSVPVVINEAKDNNWVELYNRTSKAIDLTGFKLVSQSSTVTMSGEISAKGYLVVETPTLKLKLIAPNGRFIDELYSNGSDYLRERISPWAYGSEPKNWLDEISDTQGQQNTNYQLYTYLPVKIRRNLSLPEELSPYYLSGKNIEVQENISLTFEAGVVVKMFSAGIISDGKITAVSTQKKPIVFTSFKGDLAMPGDWFGLNLTEKSQGSKFKYVDFKYGGGDFSAVLKVNGNSVDVEDCEFENNINKGLYLLNTASSVKDNRFIGINGEGTGILVVGGSDKIENNYFEKNYTGIEVGNGLNETCDVSITGNTFKENRRPIYLGTLSHKSITNNTFTDNNYNTENDANLVFLSPHSLGNKKDSFLEAGQYYSNDIFTIPSGVKLTLQPGVELSAQRGIDINGELLANGTSANPIIFRNGLLAGQTSPGKWGGLNFTATSQNSVLDNVEIYSAGNDLYGTAIKIDNCDINIKNSFVHDNKNIGIKLINSNSVIDNTRFYNHTETDYMGQYAKAVYVQGGAVEVKNSYFEKQKYAIYLTNGTTAQLHSSDPDDPEKNTFVNTEISGGNIYYAP